MRFYLIVIMLALIISGCAESDILIHEEDLMVQMNQAELSISPKYQSGKIHFIQPRASNRADSDYLPEGSEIGVFVHTLSTNECVCNLRWKAFGFASAQQWLNIDQNGLETKHYLNDKFSRLYSYYPYTKNADDLVTGHSAEDVNGYLPALRVRPGYTDYLIGNGDSFVNSNNPGTAVRMNHLLAYLRFSVVKKPGYTGSGIISKLIVKNLTSSSWVSLSTGSYIPGRLYPDLKDDLHVNTSNQDSLYVLVIPHKPHEVSESYFQVTIDGKQRNVPIPDNVTNGYNWEQGKRYTYRLFLNPDGGVTAELADFDFGGDWDAVFTNPKIVVNPGGNADELSRPTPYWDDNAQSRKFEIAKEDLKTTMNWYEGASWIRQGGSISNLTPGNSGCQTYRENGDNWRIPTYHELKFIFDQKQEGKLPDKDFQPLSGIYWSGNWIRNKNHATYWDLTKGISGDASPGTRFKIRCVRDIVN